MSIIIRLKNLHLLPLSQLLVDMQRVWDIETTTEISGHSCESGMWVRVKLNHEGKTTIIDGSRLDVVKKQIIEWVDQKQLRDYLFTES